MRGLQNELSRSTGEKRQELQAEFGKLLAQSQAAVVERRGRLPKPEFQPDLPVNERRADIAELIAQHQVVIVCGETGSGKTTQLPKICLDLGIGARGLIGHTQPRRLAARSVATRLAQELKTQVGAGVGVNALIGDRPQFSSLLLATPGSPRMLSASTLPPLPQFRFATVDGKKKRKMTAGRADYNAASWFCTPATRGTLHPLDSAFVPCAIHSRCTCCSAAGPPGVARI